jgi:hypothetical protein
LIHSPLVGPSMWAPLAAALRRRGQAVFVPELRDDRAGGGGPYWRQQADSAAAQLAAEAGAQPLVLVGHSGAGALLPAVRQALGPRAAVAGYVFVDAGLPIPGQTRLSTFGDPAEQAEFRAYLENGGRFPAWTEADLATIVPDPAARQQLIAGLRPRGLDFWTEPLPDAPGWPDAPCGYVFFSRAYAEAAADARRLGWPVAELAGGHFHMLVAPEAVAEAVLAVSRATRAAGAGS